MKYLKYLKQKVPISFVYVIVIVRDKGWRKWLNRPLKSKRLEIS